MDKGLLVIVAIGAAFIYFAINIFNTSSSGDGSEWSVPDDKPQYAQYYVKDALGDDVLNFASVSLDQAKSIWPSTPTGKNITSILPDFDLARTEIDNRIVNGAFKKYLLEYLEGLKGRFLSGEINSGQAQKALLKFN
jgi:hypothetical protein